MASDEGRGVLPFDSTLDSYEREARHLFEAVAAHDTSAEWRFKWEHPRFRGQDVAAVRASSLTLDDARTVVARTYAFDGWLDLEAFAAAIEREPGVRAFEMAVEAVVTGDLDALKGMLRDRPGLTRERSARRHHATLLHYVAANGVEGARQRTPPAAVAIATMLLDAGAEPDALADMYDETCTTLSMLVSSSPPDAAGLQVALAEVLVDRGAALQGKGTAWQSAVLTSLAFGFLETARALARRGGTPERLAEAAGLGDADAARRLLGGASPLERQIACALAAQHGHLEIVRLLLDAGEDPDRYNPERFHAHSTPLHQAAWSNHLDVVRLLAERGARLDQRDTVYHATPLGWARYGGRTAVAEYLAGLGAPDA